MKVFEYDLSQKCRPKKKLNKQTNTPVYSSILDYSLAHRHKSGHRKTVDICFILQ